MMRDDQVHIDIQAVRQLIGDQFPHYCDEEIVQIDEVGTDNAIFRIGSSVAARFPRRKMDAQAISDRLNAEMAAMREFGAICPIAAPLPIALGEAGRGYSMQWMLQSWIDGEAATSESVSRSKEVALELASHVAALRQADVKGRIFNGIGRGGALSQHEAWMEKCFAESEALLDVQKLREIWSGFRDLPPSGPDVMSHKDLIPANLLFHGQKLVGVLDAGGFGPADRSLDLIVAWHVLDADRRDVFCKALQIGELEWARGAAWAFQQSMGLVWYYRASNPQMSDLGRSTLGRIASVFGP